MNKAMQIKKCHPEALSGVSQATNVANWVAWFTVMDVERREDPVANSYVSTKPA